MIGIWVRRLLNKLLNRQYVILLEADHTFSLKIYRAYFFNGMFYLKGDNGAWRPLIKDMMARTSFSLIEAIKGQSPHGSSLDKVWAPMTDEILAFYDMIPNNYPEANENLYR